MNEYLFRTLRVQLARPFLVVTIGCVVFATHGLGAYLPAVGPAPLRFEPKSPGFISFAPKWFTHIPRPATDTVPPSPVATTPTNTNAVAATFTQPSATNTNRSSAAVTPAPIGTNSDATGEEPFMPPASYTSTAVTSQMLTEFFTSAPAATNETGITVLVPADIRFTPPTAPAGESRAIYISK